MTREELDFIGSMNMCDEISDEAYKKIVCHCREQEPCENAISREDALMCLTGEWTEITDEIIHRFIKRIKALPLVNPQPRWIPVSEILPKENKTVIASTDYCIYPEARYTEKCGWEGAYESGADYWREIEDVTAWMPLPKPYVPETNIGKVSEIPTGTEKSEQGSIGDMIMALFPMEGYYGKRAKDYYHYIGWNFPKWWNAPYKAKSEDKG